MRPVSVEPELELEALIGDNQGPSVVCIGGGHGLAQALIAVQRYAGSVQAVVTVADDGGSSGRLAPALEIPPPGDIRRCMLALTPDHSVWRQLFEYRFDESDVGGHSLGNLIIAALADLEGDFEAALRASERLLESVGSVIPSACERLHLMAKIDGAEVEGQAAISRATGHVDSISVWPASVSVNPRAATAVAAADQIVLGPGSLYTSVIASLLVPGLVDAINASHATLVFVGNLITQDAETLGMDGADHLDALLAMTGVRPPSAIVAESGDVAVNDPLEPVRFDPEVLATYGVDVVLGDLTDRLALWPQHDPAGLGTALAKLAE